jgi:hypothetical protein
MLCMMMMGISFAACSDDDDNNFDERPEVTEGQYLFTMPVNTGDGGSVECQAYVDGNELHFINLFGTTARVIYTLDESGTISSNLSDQKSLSFNSTTNVVSDHVNLKGVAQQYDISFVWPSYDIKYIYLVQETGNWHYGTEHVIIVGSKVIFPKFLGSDHEVIVNCNIDTRATDNMSQGDYVEGSYKISDDNIAVDKIYFFPADNLQQEFNYLPDCLEDGFKQGLVFVSYIGEDKWSTLLFSLPDSFEPQDDFKGISANTTLHVEVYETEATNLPTTETTPHVTYDVPAIATDKNSITLIDLFGIRYLTYTIAADNTLDYNWCGWMYSNWNYTGSHVENWIYAYKGYDYVNFDPVNAVITHSFELTESEKFVCIKVQLPDSYKR